MDFIIRNCPLCSHAFSDDGENCHSSCPMSKGCNMIKCPRCNYEFVEESSIVNFIRRMFGHAPNSMERH